MSGRFVLRYRGDGAAPASDLERVRAIPGVTVVEQTPRMMVVEGDEPRLRELVDPSPDWVMAPAYSVEVPDTRKQVRRPPGRGP